MLFVTCILLYSGWFVNRVAQEVFVAELAGMHLNGDVAGQLAIKLLIQLGLYEENKLQIFKYLISSSET